MLRLFYSHSMALSHSMTTTGWFLCLAIGSLRAILSQSKQTAGAAMLRLLLYYYALMPPLGSFSMRTIEYTRNILLKKLGLIQSFHTG